MKIYRVAVLILIFSVFSIFAQEIKITNLYDHYGETNDDLIFDGGFSILIEHNEKLILFDGGTSADILTHNVKMLGIDLKDVDIAVLSHSDYDHTTGFDYLLDINPDVKMYLPDDWSLGSPHESADIDYDKKYQKGYRFRGKNINFIKENVTLEKGIALIPTLSTLRGWYNKYPPHDEKPDFWNLPELSLAIESVDDEWTLIVGCSHSGVENIVQATNDYLHMNLFGVIGGYHLHSYSSEYVSNLAKQMKSELKVKWVAPTHCTGDDAQLIFKELYGENYKYFGAGSIIKF